ncbi:nicotinamidase/pyrazinamidase [Serratia entomophila]|jgi:nicotinamidase-related amidase|uniref:Hydrolase n=1 Tax=Serratia entomophila TaxID=42906 RepID=A0ABY5CXJ3_9GAMM|nr:hydrolase [Serratia entomophila]UIW19762.1 hydrolase [Serratia entomophila]USV02285.1 hydrolase [Serratia entomophila]CAI0719006.1 nicotinamidase/pyrazinamidase [Serratia entomophila]CAI0746051.1 nicotinamidase/pyrazinamidase [Serratia entomophila]CAI0758752.1 nicotinamidase/pyrazinamidase [Serratia entomophila]
MSKFQLLDKDNSALIFIDHQPQMSFGVANIDRQQLKNNVVGLAKAGKIFNVPTLFTSVETESFSGYIWPELLAVHPEITPIERTSMNSWEDAAFVKAVEATGRKKLVISALWTEVCLTFPALMALEAGYEVYVVTDTSGGTSADAHERAIDRMVQAGAVPVTWQQVLLEYQRDWARKDTYDAVMALVREHSGAYGMGVDYAYTMVHHAQARTVK